MRVPILIILLLSTAAAFADSKEEISYNTWMLCGGSVAVQLPDFITSIPKTTYTTTNQSSSMHHTMVWYPIKNNGGVNIAIDLYDREKLLKEMMTIAKKKERVPYAMPQFDTDCNMVGDTIIQTSNTDILLDTVYEKDGLCFSMFAKKNILTFPLRRFKGWKKATDTYMLNYKISDGKKTLSLECSVWVKHSIDEWMSIAEHIANSLEWDGRIPKVSDDKQLILNK